MAYHMKWETGSFISVICYFSSYS